MKRIREISRFFFIFPCMRQFPGFDILKTLLGIYDNVVKLPRFDARRIAFRAGDVYKVFNYARWLIIGFSDGGKFLQVSQLKVIGRVYYFFSFSDNPRPGRKTDVVIS